MANEELISALSKVAGETTAVSAIVFAICRNLPSDSPMSKEIERHLEQAYTHHLQASTNPAFFEGFEQVMELAKLALKEPPND